MDGEPQERSEVLLEPAPRIELSLDHDPCVQYALQQNDVPLVRLLRIENAGERTLEDLVVRIELGSDLAAPFEVRIARLEPGAIWNIEDFDLDLPPERLRRQAERERTTLVVRVLQGELELARIEEPLAILAFNEWGGLDSLPELAAAFVCPNDPALDALLARAATHLRAATGDGSLAGYQRPGRTRAQAEALWRACCDLELGYINPPASFEQGGQKVRLPGRVVEHRLGTCLDLVLLMAAGLEQIGLHPWIVLTEGHALCALWERPEVSPGPFVDDHLRLWKRIELGEILCFETTLLTSRPPADFEGALRAARRTLADGTDFRGAIDVHAARRRRIRPLPVPGAAPSQGVVDPSSPASFAEVEPATSAAAGRPARRPPEEPPPPPPEPERSPDARIGSWKRRLLDLSLRNRFLNFRATRRTLPLECPDLIALEDLVASGKSFVLRPRTEPLAAGRSARAHEERTGEDAREAFLRAELLDGALHCELDGRELDARLVELFRGARLSLEETGANTLYLALGFLHWTESPTSTRELRAPIVLIPMALERRSMREGFRLRSAEEEPWINVTLLEKLKADFGLDVAGLDELPEDGAGIDLAEILRRWRRAVRDVERWHVREEASLGLFSFAKFLMWRDLELHAELLRAHPVVRHLVERPGEEFDPEPFPDPRQLDSQVPPQEMLLPLDADSSQLAAVVAAAGQGRSFVLQGPPGTGKSQTITNLVAQCLATDKRVLFVAEKQAALSVVQRRLEEVGLGPFCLELHSHKASKREVMAQLEAALSVARSAPPGGWELRAAELFELRAELNGLVEELHRNRPLGRSVFEVTGRVLALGEGPRIELSVAAVEQLEGERLRRDLEGLETLVAAAEDAGDPASHPLRAVGCAKWRLELPEEVRRGARALRSALEALAPALARAGRALGFFDARSEGDATPLDASRRELGELAAAVQHLFAAPYPAPPPALSSEPGWRELEPALREAARRAGELARRRTALEQRWRPESLERDPAPFAARLAAAQRTFWPLSWWRRRALAAELAPLRAGAPPRDPASLRADLEEWSALRVEAARLTDPASDAARLLEPLWRAGRGDARALESAIAWAGRTRELILALAGADLERGARLRERFEALTRAERDALAPGASLGEALRSLPAALLGFEQAWRELVALLELDEPRIFQGGAPLLGRVAALLEALEGPGSALRDWCRWRAARAALADSPAAPVVEGIEGGTLAPADARAAFERSLLELWLRRTCDASPVLRSFHGGEQRRRIERFRRLDRGWIERTRELLAARLSARVPGIGSVTAPTSELGILARELKKTRRHLPVRKLFEALPNLLPRLKPCVLMSPLSAAQFLSAGFSHFDLVVFDEASQIPVWDAVGAIARGRGVVVVGDSKQLPPTNFFARLEDEDAPAEDDFEELESLLDECVAARLPQAHLAWHYRSRHESLIAFSNARYYRGELLTFSSAEPSSQALGVSLRRVEGAVYDRGKSATNRREAEELVGEALRLLRSGADDPRAGAARSLGIVTFSLAQQRLVEELLEAARGAEPELERHFDAAAREPVFVKNLENVQGDERDVILLGVGYGPDAAGRLALNFGPLNRAGGERRLNVAITRARRRLVVFASFRPEAIELARTQSVGLRDLKTFLDYAERGPRAIAEHLEIGEGGASPFERAVQRRLEELGWGVDPQVGCSGYRIDLGVRHPEVPGSYLLGIECDGRTYRSAATARDRDRLRAGVLEGLGWRLERAWCTDWWLDPEREVRRLEEALRAALEADAARRAAQTAEGEAVAQGGAADAPSSSPGDPFPQADAGRPDPQRERADGAGEGNLLQEVPPAFERSSGPGARGPAEPLERNELPLPFRPYPGGPSLGSLETLADGRSRARLGGALAQLIELEGPIERQRAARLFAERLGVARTSGQIAERVLALLEALPAERRPAERDGFLWPPRLDPDTWRAFRVAPSEGEDPRSCAEIAPQELANAAYFVLTANVRLPLTDLARETAKLFGRRLGKQTESSLRAAILLLAQRGEALIDADFVALP